MGNLIWGKAGEGNYFKFWLINFGRLFEGGEDAYSSIYLMVIRLYAKNNKKQFNCFLLLVVNVTPFETD